MSEFLIRLAQVMNGKKVYFVGKEDENGLIPAAGFPASLERGVPGIYEDIETARFTREIIRTQYPDTDIGIYEIASKKVE